MDTHIAPPPELADYRSEPTARVPGEPDLDAASAQRQPRPGDKTEQTTPAPPSRERRRSSLLGGVAIAVLVTAGTGAFILSPYNHIVPVSAGVRTQVRQIAAKAGVNLDTPLAPSAGLARVAVPNRPIAEVRPSYQSRSPDEGLRELLAMQTGSAPTSSPAAASPPPNVPVSTRSRAAAASVQEPGGAAPAPPAIAPAAPSRSAVSPSPAAHPDITGTVTAAALAQASSPSPSAPAPASPDHAAPPPTDAEHTTPARPVSADNAGPVPSPADKALAQLEHLRAAPMTDTQQVQVLQAVTEIATLVKDLKAQDAALRADYTKQLAESQARLADFERRINLAEAHAAIRSASAAVVDTPSAPPSLANPPANVEPAIVRQISATAAAPATYIAPAPGPVTPKRYRLRAASPGLAMLAEEARGGGDGAQIQVSVGDIVPGWGVVKSVAQKGSNWVVNTEHGAIE